MASAPSGPQLGGDNNTSSSSSSHHPTASTSYPSTSCSSYSTLVQYLWQAPFFFNYRFDDHACKAILSYCYESLWQQNPALMEQYFYSSPQELQQAIEKQLKYRSSSSSNQEHDMDTTTTTTTTHSSGTLQVWHSNAIVPPIDSSSERGRQCGHVFRKGEPVYRCRTCGLDDTCVFCSRCFHATQHDGHDVLFSVSPGSGGCCDCGDPEAWKVPLNCKIHTDTSMGDGSMDDQEDVMNQVPAKIIESIRTTIAATLDFVLDTLTLAPEDIALPNNTSSSSSSTRTDSRDANDSQDEDKDVDMDKENNEFIFLDGPRSSMEQSTSTTSQDGNEEEYVCLAWNDEGHAFSHVLECLMSATGCEWERAKEMVDAIHNHGREVIAVSKSVDQLKKIAAPLAAINLGVTIRSTRDVYREKVCNLLIFWLKELVHGDTRFFNNVPGGDAIIRTIVAEELCAEWEIRNSVSTTSKQSVHPGDDDDDDENIMKDDSAMLTTEKGISEDTEMYESTNTTYAPSTHPASTADSQYDAANIDWNPASMIQEFHQLRSEENQSWENTIANVSLKGKQPDTLMDPSKRLDRETTMALASQIQLEFKKKLRLDYFMLYDLKLWKEMRIALRELYIASLAPSRTFKKTLGKRLARNYARLAESFLLKDREPEISIILFSVQLLTVPSVADLLVNQYEFFGLVCSALTAFFLTDHLYLLLPSERAESPSRINCESRAFRTRRYFNAFHDLRYIMNVDMIKPVLVQDPLYLRQFLDLISMFQSMNAQLCQKDTHVEYESEIWVNAFNVTLQIAKCCRQFSECFAKLPKSTDADQLAMARVLIRCITSVLKKIQDWDTSPDDMRQVPEDNSQSRQPRPTTQQPGVAGASSQVFHTIHPPYIEQPLEIVEYDILSQPVSFHHPLHWLLACFLEHAFVLNDQTIEMAGYPGRFAQVITLFKNSTDDQVVTPDTLLPILEYPLRTIAFSAQIRAGVWVRNGYGIRNQAHHYRDISLRENTYDADVFLLQVGFATIDADKLLVTLMDRFGLYNWFNGERSHPHYDTTQTTFMVEELLNLLIVCASEQANVTGMTVEHRIRREIIHNLCLGPVTFSELIRRIPERLHEHAAFDHVLSQVGDYKAPIGINDAGSYRLKDECYNEVDPYFYHYSRNNREEAVAILKERWNKQHDGNKFFVTPRLPQLQNGPFSFLGDFLQSKVFTQMMAYTLWNIRLGGSHKSDTNLDQALYLIMLALTDSNHRQPTNSTNERGGFYEFVCAHYFPFSDEDQSEELSLLDILFQLRDDEENYKEIHAQLDWIFDRLEEYGPGRTRRATHTWRNGRMKVSETKNENGDAASEYQKKKQAALERQKKIMAQFAQAQSQFMEQNEGLYDEDEDDEILNGANDASQHPVDDGTITRLCAYPTGTCIVCQEDVDEKSESYGMLGLIQTSDILRQSPSLHDAAVLSHICSMQGSLDVEWPDEQALPDDFDHIPGKPAQLHKTGLYASTCGHLMHIQCFEVYCTSIDSRHSSQLTRNQPENRTRNEFMCPLCKSLGNILLPIYWKGRKEEFPGVIQQHDDNDYSSFLQSQVQSGADRIKQAVINRAQRRRTSGGSKLKEALNTYVVPYLRTVQGESSSDDWLGFRGPIFSSDSATGGGQQDATAAAMDTTSFTETRWNVFDRDLLHGTTFDNYATISQMYTRLFDVLSIIYRGLCNDETMQEMSSNVKSIDLLWGLVGYTITSVEIAARGSKRPEALQPDDTDTLFDQIPAQTRMLLRILCDSVLGYTHVMCQQNASSSTTGPTPNQVNSRVHLYALSRLRQIFPDVRLDDLVEMHGLSYDRMLLCDNPPLLQDDPFMILSELTFHGIRFTKMNTHAMIRVLLLAEITKTVVAIVQDQLKTMNEDDEATTTTMTDSDETPPSPNVRHFCMFVMQHLNFSETEANHVFDMVGASKFQALIQSFALPFLRRTLILMIVRHGYIVNGRPPMEDANTNEFDRLLNLLCLPSLDELIQLDLDSQLVAAWCEQHVSESSRELQLHQETMTTMDTSAAARLVDIALDTPTPLYLLPLPRRFEQLIDESMRRICAKCGTIPTDPSICLLCGTFVCTQSFCCADGEYGECNLHSFECGGEIGIFLSVKRCVLILLHNDNGWFMNAPYLDSHGEVDLGLRRGKPQYLSLKRYAELRKLWLQHNIPVYVARQIEANFDVGGWTTL